MSRCFRDLFSSLKQFLSSWRQNPTLHSSHIQGAFMAENTLFVPGWPSVCSFPRDLLSVCGDRKVALEGLCGPARGRTLRGHTYTIIYNINVLSTKKTTLKGHLNTLPSCSFSPLPQGNLVMYRFLAFTIRWNYIDSTKGRGVTVI